jgi:hypothetical protein
MEEEDSDWFLLLADDASMGDINNGYNNPFGDAPTDFEQANYEQHMAPEDHHFLVSPTHAASTSAWQVEVTLLKILTELEMPLWAFQVILDWVYDAAQAGCNFMPHQASYQSQVDTLAQWVGMAHMHPTVVEVKLLGAQPGNSISVTMFDCISQFHSLLSDK